MLQDVLLYVSLTRDSLRDAVWSSKSQQGRLLLHCAALQRLHSFQTAVDGRAFAKHGLHRFSYQNCCKQRACQIHLIRSTVCWWWGRHSSRVSRFAFQENNPPGIARKLISMNSLVIAGGESTPDRRQVGGVFSGLKLQQTPCPTVSPNQLRAGPLSDGFDGS